MVSDEKTRKARRRLVFAGALAALTAVLILIGVWARYTASGSGNVDENLTTTTDPFEHIDRNQMSDDSAVDENAATSSNTVSADAEVIARPANWAYTNHFDQVRGGAIYRASLDSENSAFFDFPYQGGSTLTMTVRKHPEYGDDVIFKISRGQFVCRVEECSGTINFGSGPQAISFSEPTDNSSDTLFATDPGFVIEQLRKTKSVIIELPFYQEGYRQFTFEMKNSLEWPPKDSEIKSSSKVDGNVSPPDND